MPVILPVPGLLDVYLEARIELPVDLFPATTAAEKCLQKKDKTFCSDFVSPLFYHQQNSAKSAAGPQGHNSPCFFFLFPLIIHLVMLADTGIC